MTSLNPFTDKRVDVCVCTFRRVSVVDTLGSLAAQRLPEGWRMRIIVADNDDAPSARERVTAAFTQLGLDGVYIHAPARNISISRNACLDAITAPLAAFIDDDETASPDWLARLIESIETTGADVVFGSVNAVYAADAPRWMVSGDLHSTRAVVKGGVVDGGYTCNVMFRSQALSQRRFDPALGRSGGEDTIFFSKFYLEGGKAAYAPEAMVNEPVPASRSSLDWLMKRSFRSGQTRASALLLRGRSRAWLVSTATPKALFSALSLILTVFSASRWRKAAVRAALHMGVVAGALGKAPLELYGHATQPGGST